MKLVGNMKVQDNMLSIGGITAKELKEQFGTPLVVYDEKEIRDLAKMFRENFKSDKFQTEVIYASKAFLCKAMVRLVEEEKLSLDTVSGGEIYTASCTNYPMEKVYFHGNNKLEDEILMAFEKKVGTFIINGKEEAIRLEKLAKENNVVQRVILRVNPGIEAHTHEYIQTAKSNSKFGESIFDGTAIETLEFASKSSNLELVGLHCHIGSQIFAKDGFFQAVDVMFKFVKDMKEKYNIELPEINLGGGFGVYYTEGDTPLVLEEFLKELVKEIEERTEFYGVTPKKVMIEPGRSLVCTAGTTLYTAGDIKKTESGIEYIFVDGGMCDNPRPALYQAKYEALVANKAEEEAKKEYRIGGKCCESGDILIYSIKLPQVESGDIIAIGSTGAYTYSMSGNYNRITRPAVVFVEDGKARLVVRRETMEDLIQYDC